MNKYRLNDGMPGLAKTVEAAKYEREGDYFIFLDEEGDTVFMIKATQVITVAKM